MTPQIIAQYRDSRTAKVRANQEISLLSHIYNIAREWGVGENNPAAGVRKNKEALQTSTQARKSGALFTRQPPRSCATRWTWPT